jgi:hypothetical protein
MIILRSQTTICTHHSPVDELLGSIAFHHLAALLALILFLVGTANAQDSPKPKNNEEVVVFSGVNESDVFGLGNSIRITGTVKQGAIAFGGDVIVEGTVDGDVAAIGGSVVQLAGARIGGDVIVLGGNYRHIDEFPNRNSDRMTMIVAGYQEELRNLMQNPSGILRPHLSSGYLGLRLLAILFWFIVCLALTAAMPGPISRGVVRLQLTSLRVAVIGLIGAVAIAATAGACLWMLPQTISVLVGIMASILVLVSWLFGRVVLAAATGKWLQRKYIPWGNHSEAVALLLGTTFWVLMTSLPYMWPFVVLAMVVISIGLALTARYRAA